MVDSSLSLKESKRGAEETSNDDPWKELLQSQFHSTYAQNTSNTIFCKSAIDDESKDRQISGGQGTIAKLFVHGSTGRVGAVGQWDAICFDEATDKIFKERGYFWKNAMISAKKLIIGEIRLVTLSPIR